MKSLALVLGVIGLNVLSAPAFAAANAPLVTKSSGGGFTPPDWIRAEQCKVFADKVIITKQFGGGPTGFELSEERKIALSAGIKAALVALEKEVVAKTENTLCDGPSSTIVTGPSNSPTVLFTTGGCGSPRLEREGPNSNAVRAVVDAYCPQTFDIRH